MIVDDLLVEKLARLSKLQFSANEKEAIKKDLHGIIAFVEKLDQLQLEDVKPLLQVGESFSVYREDSIQGSVTREEALKNASNQDGQFFNVPKVIKK
jgi:aspartyl-tRNA(Asn)/glutamyl-tRNA(Gln) amidotransferase subunit C